jgi:hypothetical protein
VSIFSLADSILLSLTTVAHDDHMETLREAQLGDNEGDCGSEIGMEDEELAHSIEGDDTYIVLKAVSYASSLQRGILTLMHYFNALERELE